MAARYLTRAKVNLFLRVGARREDGYHEVETVLHSVDLADELSIRRTTGIHGVTFLSDDRTEEGLPRPRDSTIWRALDLLKSDRQLPIEPVVVDVEKHIPVGAGLGGGSSNGAGTLIAMNEVFDLGLHPAELEDLGAKIGSDVPFMLRGGTARAVGRGEVLMQLVATPMWFVLGLSRTPLLTAAVYESFDCLPGPAPTDATRLISALRLDAVGVAACLHNDLEAAAVSLRPELDHKKSVLAEAGALGVLLSGSGPTVFGIARDEFHAHELAGAVRHAFDDVVVAGSASRAVERIA